MTPETMKAPHRGNGGDLRNTVLANCSTNSLDALRAQYLAETFGVPSDTALVLAELAFGGDHE